MAKIDVTKIDGYQSMTAEEKIAALEAFEVDEKPQGDSAEVKKLKEIISTRNGEVADFKRKWQATLDESQKAELERQEKQAALEQELETLRGEKKLSAYKADFLAAGYTNDLAETSAKAMLEGDTATVFSNLSAFLAAQKKNIEAEALKQQPTITPGAVPGAQKITKEQFNKMTYPEIVKLKTENPTLFGELFNNL